MNSLDSTQWVLRIKAGNRMMTNSPVVIYVTPWCPYCRRALGFLKQKGINSEVIDVSGDRKTRQWLVEATGQHTVPQIFVHGRSIGGCDDMLALDRRGEFDPLLEKPAPEQSAKL
jgi:glutaredoxin 3